MPETYLAIVATGEAVLIRHGVVGFGVQTHPSAARRVRLKAISVARIITSDGEVLFEETGSDVAIDRLSDGYRSTLAWVDDVRALFPNIQFIVSSHSPFVAQNLETDDKVLVLAKNGERVEVRDAVCLDAQHRGDAARRQTGLDQGGVLGSRAGQGIVAPQIAGAQLEPHRSMGFSEAYFLADGDEVPGDRFLPRTFTRG